MSRDIIELLPTLCSPNVRSTPSGPGNEQGKLAELNPELPRASTPPVSSLSSSSSSSSSSHSSTPSSSSLSSSSTTNCPFSAALEHQTEDMKYASLEALRKESEFMNILLMHNPNILDGH